MARGELYPEIEPYQRGELRLDDRHLMYWEQCGNPAGVPVVVLHGGPGTGCSPAQRRFFDPGHWRVVLFDQRGAGRSRPLGETIDNTTPHLVEDIERLRRHLGIERWLVFGGSWGSTLALAYAEAHPERCRALVLRGIFLGRAAEVDWFLHGMRQFAPETWQRFRDFLPPAERGDLLGAYHRRLLDPDPAVHLPAAQQWSVYEGGCCTLLPSPETVRAFEEPAFALGLARLEAHYFASRLFLAENQLIAEAGRIAAIPGIIVQGRYDLVCPPASALDLAAAWPRGHLTIVPDAGHSAMEPGIRAELVGALEQLKTLG